MKGKAYQTMKPKKANKNLYKFNVNHSFLSLFLLHLYYHLLCVIWTGVLSVKRPSHVNLYVIQKLVALNSSQLTPLLVRMHYIAQLIASWRTLRVK